MAVIPVVERFGPVQMLRELLALPADTLVKSQYDELIRIKNKGSRSLKKEYIAFVEVQYKHYIVNNLPKTYNCSVWKN